MEETKGDDYVLAFDTLFTNNQIQIMKTVLPYLDQAMQKQIAIMIKYMELNYTITYLQKHSIPFCSHNGRQEPDMQEMFPKIQAFLSPSERSRVEQIMNMMNMMQTVNQYQEMMQFMNASESDSESDSDPADFLMNMLSPEQKAMFEMFQNS